VISRRGESRLTPALCLLAPRHGATPSSPPCLDSAGPSPCASGLQKMHPLRVQIFCSRTDAPSGLDLAGALSASGLQKMHPLRVQIFCSRTDAPSGLDLAGALSASGLQKMHPLRVQIFCSRTDAPSGLDLAGAPGRGLKCLPIGRAVPAELAWPARAPTLSGGRRDAAFLLDQPP
jgi:hypothetical protein